MLEVAKPFHFVGIRRYDLQIKCWIVVRGQYRMPLAENITTVWTLVSTSKAHYVSGQSGAC